MNMKKFLSLFIGIGIILSVSAASVFALEYTKNVKIKVKNTSSYAYTNIYDVNGRVKRRLITLRVAKNGVVNDPVPYSFTCSMIWWPDQKVEVKASGDTSSHYADVNDSVRSMGLRGTLTCNISLTKSYTITNDDYE